jgi:hypothetical protein
LTRNPGAPAVATAPAASEHVAADHVHPVANPVHDPWNPDDRHVDRDVQTLVHLADLRRSSRLSANWARIEKPLAPYRALLEGTTP